MRAVIPYTIKVFVYDDEAVILLDAAYHESGIEIDAVEEEDVNDILGYLEGNGITLVYGDMDCIAGVPGMVYRFDDGTELMVPMGSEYGSIAHR